MQQDLNRILVIQTAFPGDVILATGVLESLHHLLPQSQIDFLLRKGNESLFDEHPYLHEVLILDKKKGKMSAISSMAKKVRAEKYDFIVNLHRFGSSGIICLYSGAGRIVGFRKNPFSFAYTQSFPHLIDGTHETERNFSLLNGLEGIKYFKPKLYPAQKHYNRAAQIISPQEVYVCIAPSSVWFTKELPEKKWMDLVKLFPDFMKVIFIGGPADEEKCHRIISGSGSQNCINAAGKLSLLESAALMQYARMNYTNDSAPLHLATAVNAASKSFFLSTVPEFGFTGLSDNSSVIQVREKLECRPCGLHGHRACPKTHFKCAEEIPISEELLRFD